ncbi:ATP-binding cassette domain-containing protein [Microbacterium sp. SSW1-47]|uniref:ATP-binding cassette domain-containing protein n=1 Tax=Microbacterium sufflavum TaxID=2851649 RepID=UPI001FFC65F8|nr:ATP-binding cassette domain-containing protein [Microbacterium sufflavum]MCK2025330.1 ATP-binding cassette domain-containing protein [Microbacterium sufflavum]
MPEGQVLEFTNVTKRFNEVTAVSDFSARVEPGAVTAFLGPNGAGKTTTLRILLGQVRATSGTATIGGVAYPELRQPLRTIGSVLEETVYRPRRTASRQLTIAAKANGIRLSRVDEVLSLVGLESEADSRIGGFSLGMRQRLSVAHALLGDPGALVFDEPANGLDPEGIRWMRLLMRRLADEGRTVLVSSHVLSEIEQVADHVLVLSKGRLVLSSGIETLADPAGGSVIVDSVDRPGLTTALVAAGFDIEVLRSGLTVRGADASTVGAVAAEAGIALSTLVQRGPTLEDVFIDLMRGGRFGTAAAAAGGAAPGETAATDTNHEASDSSADVATAGAGAAASALAAGGAAALADDLTTETMPEPTDATAEDDDVDEQSTDAEPASEDLAAADTEDSDVIETVAEVTAITGPVAVVPVEEDVRPVTMEDAARIGDGDSLSESHAEPATSFDEILFGGTAPVQEDEPTERPTRRSLAQLFATTPESADDDHSASPEHVSSDEQDSEGDVPTGSDDAESTGGSARSTGSAPTEEGADEAPENGTEADETPENATGADETPVDEPADHEPLADDQESALDSVDDAHDSESPADEAPADDTGIASDEPAADPVPADDEPVSTADDESIEEDPAGIEFFAELDDAEEADETDEADHGDRDAEEAPLEAVGTDGAATPDEDEDPRAAAVSSLLSAAARAYYEDEPRDYPLSTADSMPATGAPGEPHDAGAHWSVATTGVIDTVPLARDTATDGQDDHGTADAHHQPDDGVAEVQDGEGHAVPEHDDEHSGDHDGEHSGDHDGEHSGDHDGDHSGEHSDEHDGEHSGDHDGEHSEAHSDENSDREGHGLDDGQSEGPGHDDGQSDEHDHDGHDREQHTDGDEHRG